MAELTKAQKFFALVYRYFAKCDEYTSLYSEIKAIESTGLTEEHSNLEELKARHHTLFQNAKGIEQLIKAEIANADAICEKKGIEKFWLNE